LPIHALGKLPWGTPAALRMLLEHWVLLFEYARAEEDRAMNISIAHLHAIVAIVIGILILVVPRLLSYLVAIYLILTGLIGLGFVLHLPR
jgi:hypothetical protein